MSKNFKKHLDYLSLVSHQFTQTSASEKLQRFKAISSISLPNNEDFFTYHIILLYTLTHPENEEIYKLANYELLRLAKHLQKPKNANQPIFADSGLPYTTMTTRFSQDAFNKLILNDQIEIRLESLGNPSFDLNAFLNITLPKIFKEETTAGLPNEDILKLFGVDPKRQVEFLINEINSDDSTPLAKDFLWQSLQAFFTIQGKHLGYSKSFNKLSNPSIYYQKDLYKKFDHQALLQKKINPPKKLTEFEKEEIINVIFYSMPLAMREIDPTTYMDTNSLRVFELERGLSVVLYGMRAERQLSMQSFVGFTLFKNGYPMSYGGSWIFGECAMFSLNIFEEFRGGESKFIMTQILRVYIQMFKITYYEIEPYQFNNDEAIATGAFWFYYHFGFRPKDENLQRLALVESVKIQKNKSYRTSNKTLRTLGQSNLEILLSKKMPVHRNKILAKILNMIAKQYKGSSNRAIIESIAEFREKANFNRALNKDETQVLEEIALWVKAFAITDKKKLSLLTKMIYAKGFDYISYNNYAIQILKK